MLRTSLIAASFAFALGLTACAPPADDAAKAEATAQAAADLATEKAAAEEKAAKEAAEAKEAAKEAAREVAQERDAAAAKKRPRPSEPAPAPAPVVCNECGTVASVEPVKERGEGSGAGAVLGAIAGGVIGHQFGGGKGKDVATAGGAVLGGVAGHQAEKSIRSTTHYVIGVNMDNGSFQTVSVPDPAGISPGAKVRVSGGNIQLR